jgi:acylphosphatase
MPNTAAKRWFVTGTVQGVGFRYFVQSKARNLGLCGFARNLSDGRVEVYATGDATALTELAAALHLGPPLSRVRTVEEREEESETHTGFAVR